MKREEIHKLLGGYATGTLTEAERQALFEAALEDQQLFDAIAREQTLRDLLRDGAARAQILSALEPAPPARPWNWRPAATVLAMAAIAAVTVVVGRHPRPVLVGEAVPPANPVAAAGQPAAGSDAAPAAAIRPFVVPPPAHVRSKSVKLEEAPKTESTVPPLPPALARVQLAEGPKPPAQLRMATGAMPVAESMFESAAGARAVRPMAIVRVAQPTARDIFYRNINPTPVAGAAGALAAPIAAPEAARMALRYTVLRKNGAGAFLEAAPRDLQPGDTFELRFTANTAGYLALGENPPVALTGMAPYVTPPLTAGESALKVVFSASPERDIAAEEAFTETRGNDVYVAARVPGRPLSFTISLK